MTLLLLHTISKRLQGLAVGLLNCSGSWALLELPQGMWRHSITAAETASEQALAMPLFLEGSSRHSSSCQCGSTLQQGCCPGQLAASGPLHGQLCHVSVPPSAPPGMPLLAVSQQLLEAFPKRKP